MILAGDEYERNVEANDIDVDDNGNDDDDDE